MLIRTSSARRFSRQAVQLLHPEKHQYAEETTFELPLSGNFEKDFRKNHINISFFQKTLLTVGSAAITILDPFRADMLSCLGETTGKDAAAYVFHKMIESEEGSRILSEQPRINSNTVDLESLKKYPEGTVGKVYSNWLKDNNVSPNSRLPVRFMDDVKLAYVMQRYREVHDLTHAILSMPTHMLGEVAIKWVEAIQTKLPMCIAGAIFGPVRLRPKQRKNYIEIYLPWAIQTGLESKFLMNIYYEKRWDQPLADLHQEMNIKPLVLSNGDK
ncbi:ubiquinone biosynthesis protein COQ4 homolog, mitochondrial [Agrilus planipennis]|uniref:Ubiquinone biosynthesis protein COQ4 homolog, mitochondrial n=1 Tax=Agrilus planipennis TaxID=224129 RepID=A0A1W4XKE4_AGRPL|nr:ubiquinone biosynthesis protein COQ4 homolog, mitochondrial [Agrilus planipennis]